MATLSNTFKNYISLSASSEIDQIISPIKNSIGIDYVLFIKELNDGSRFWVTNRGDWTECFYEQQLYQLSAFEDPTTAKIPGQYLWSQLKGQEVFQIAKEQFNIAHGITITEKASNGFEFFHLATNKSNQNIINIYANHSEVFKKFFTYFKHNAKNLIKLSEKNKVEVPLPKDKQNSHRDYLMSPKMSEIELNTLLNSLICERFTFSNNEMETYLTRKEIECMQWLIKGKTCEEIATIMNLSKRTIETHVNRVKEKLNCYKQFQLGYLLGKAGLF